MNFDLAQMYGTPVSHEVSEDQEKVAQAELFAKLAAENGIDLNQLSDEQVTALWGATFEKDAAEEPAAEEKKEEKKEEEEEKGKKAAAAVAEFEAQKEWQEKVAEMDYLGRLMAHAYVQELGSINENLEKQAWSITESGHKLDTAKAKAMSQAHDAAAGAEHQYSKESPYLSSVRTGFIGPQGAAHQLAARHQAAVSEAHGRGENVYNPFKGMATKTKAEKERLKQSSAIDEFAAQLAVEKAAEAGWDGDEAVARINSIFTLGAIGPSEKIAAAQDVDGAVDIRSLEILEAAGYPVTWE